MNRTISFFRTDLFSYKNAYFWIGLAIAVRVCFWALYMLQHVKSFGSMPDFWGGFAGDSRTYLQPVEAFYLHGIYADPFKFKSEGLVPYSGRMPGLGVVFLVFRLFFSFYGALNAIIITQLLVSSVACYVLGLTCKKIAGSVRGFYVGFFAFLFNMFVSIYDYFILCESLAISFFIIGTYFLITASDRKAYILGAGFFLGWLFFLRPYTLPIFLAAGVWLAIQNSFHRRVILFFVPFLIADTAWVIRNYANEKRIIFAQSDIWAGINYSEARLSLYSWVQSWGGDIVQGNRNSEIGAFISSLWKNKYEKPADLPEYVYCSYYNSDSLTDWKSKFDSTEIHPQKERFRNNSFERLLVMRMKNYREAYIKERPFEHYVMAYPRLAIKFFNHNGTHNFSPLPFEQLSLRQKVIKIVYGSMFITFVTFGFFIGLGLLAVQIYRRRYFEELTFFLCISAGMFFVLIFLRFIEYRYAVILYPTGIISWAVMTSKIR